METERTPMLTQTQEQQLTDSIPDDVVGEERRTADSVIIGYRDGKTFDQIVSYYSLDRETANHWYSTFGFNSNKKTDAKKRGRKGKDIKSYINSNIGRTLSAKDVSSEVGISLPTFYNFYNSNRGYFKKVSRGQFEIINPATERVSDS